MEQLVFNLDDLYKKELKKGYKNSKPYYYKLVNNDIEEKNIEGIQKQKKLIKKYLIDSGIKEHEKIVVRPLDETFNNTLYTDGFHIEGYKIKYEYEKILLYFDLNYRDYNIDDKYISSKLKNIYLMLKDKFDVKPVYTTITDYKFNKTIDELGREIYIKDLNSKQVYKVIKYIEISKDKEPINIEIPLIDNLTSNIEDFIEEYIYNIEE